MTTERIKELRALVAVARDGDHEAERAYCAKCGTHVDDVMSHIEKVHGVDVSSLRVPPAPLGPIKLLHQANVRHTTWCCYCGKLREQWEPAEECETRKRLSDTEQTKCYAEAREPDVNRPSPPLWRMAPRSSVLMPLTAESFPDPKWLKRGYEKVMWVNESGNFAVLVHKEPNRIFILKLENARWDAYCGGLVEWLKGKLNEHLAAEEEEVVP